jgi:predicted DNA-binding transcriptional regulator YafY
MTTDSEAERSVHPYGLLFQHGRWYLVGYDTDRDAERMYRVGRIADLVVNSKKAGTADYEVPEDFTLRSYRGRKAWELGADDAEPTEVTVRFRFPRSLWAERNGHGTLIEEEDDGSQRRRFTVHRSDPFLRWVLSLAGDAAVIAPAQAAEAFRGLAARVAAVHGAGATGGRAEEGRGAGADEGRADG